MFCPSFHLSVRGRAKRIPLLETLSDNIGMFVSRTRTAGHPARRYCSAAGRKLHQQPFPRLAELGLQPFLEGDQKRSHEVFYIDAAKEGECPSSALHPPTPQIFTDGLTFQLWITDSLNQSSAGHYKSAVNQLPVVS